MIDLCLAIVSSALVSIVMRLSERRVRGTVSMLAVNYFMCLFLAATYTGVENLFPDQPGLVQTVGLGAINGALYLLGFVLLQISVKKNGVVLSATFMKLGLLVPLVVSVVFFGELPKPAQIVGACIAVAAIILINFEKEDSELGVQAGLLLLLLLAGGGGDAMSKVFEELGNGALSEQFLLYTFLFALLFCLALVLHRREKPGKADLFFGLLIGIPNYFSARFLLKSLEHLAAVIVYPTYSVATIVVVTMAGVCFFRERLKKRQWVAVAAILVALALLNL